MHPLHPAMTEDLCRARSRPPRRSPAPARPYGRVRPRRRPFRTTVGWFLINVGFRLAIPEPPLASLPR